MGPLHLNFGAKITELSIFQTICLLSILCESNNSDARFVARWRGSRRRIFYQLIAFSADYLRSLRVILFAFILNEDLYFTVIQNFIQQQPCVYVRRFIVIRTQLKMWAVIIHIQIQHLCFFLNSPANLVRIGLLVRNSVLTTSTVSTNLTFLSLPSQNDLKKVQYPKRCQKQNKNL